MHSYSNYKNRAALVCLLIAQGRAQYEAAAKRFLLGTLGARLKTRNPIDPDLCWRLSVD